MATKNIKSKEGFTIIEVVLVLAVAGLIFLMVFIALPALQRSQRDTQRRQSISSVHAALTQYQTNHSTKADNLPTAGTCTVEQAGQLYVTSTSYNSNDGIMLASTTGVQIATGESGTGTGTGTGATAATGSTNSTACKFIKDYMNSTGATENTFVDPDGTEYGMTIADFGDGVKNARSEGSEVDDAFAPETFDHTIYVIRNSQCDGDVAVQGNGKRNFSVLYMLEGSSVLCLDNS